jgi:hypothetical protein
VIVLRHWKQLLLWSGVAFFLFAIVGNTYRAIDYRVGVNEGRAPSEMQRPVQ